MYIYFYHDLTGVSVFFVHVCDRKAYFRSQLVLNIIADTLRREEEKIGIGFGSPFPLK